MKITKQQLQNFMSARHPGMKYNKLSNSWVGNGHGIGQAEALSEAMAEIELAKSGIAKMPAWATE